MHSSRRKVGGLRVCEQANTDTLRLKVLHSTRFWKIRKYRLGSTAVRAGRHVKSYHTRITSIRMYDMYEYLHTAVQQYLNQGQRVGTAVDLVYEV